KGFQVHALRGPRERRPGARLHQGVPHRLPALRQQGRDEGAGREPRQATARAVGFRPRRSLRSGGRRRHPRALRPARRHQSGGVRRPAEQSARPVDGVAVEETPQVARQPRHGRRPDRRLRPLPAFRTEDHRGGPRRSESGRKAMRDESHVLPNGRVQRYTFRERLMHWVAGFSYLYLLITGLAFWSPWLFGLTAITGGPTISRLLHPWVGVVFFLATVWMYVIWSAQMRESPGDKAWWRSIKHYIRNEDSQVPDEERFNPGQKLLFWGFFWCGLVLLLTGIVLWIPEWIPWSLRFLRLIAIIVHPIAALFTIALFIIHVYMGTAVERGAFSSIVRGDVSRTWAQRFHRAWYEQVVRQSPNKE